MQRGHANYGEHSMSHSTWSLNPADFMKTVEQDLTVHHKKMAIDALTTVVMQSPVDDGAFRASHRLSIGSPDLSYDENQKDKSGGSSIAKGNAMLQGLVPFTTIYIQTNSPYAKVIEYGDFTEKPETAKTIGGYSKQAPHGVYGISFQLVKAKYT